MHAKRVFPGLFSLLVSAASAAAGGLYLNEYASPSMGTAGAGQQAGTDDASTAWHNPAGMTRLEGTRLLFGAGLASSSLRFTPAQDTPVPGGDGGNAGGSGALLCGFFTSSLSEKSRWGLAVVSPVAWSRRDYEDDWAGRYLADEVELSTLAVMPSIAYRFNKVFSLAVGVPLVYGKLRMSAFAPPPAGSGQALIDGNDWTAGINISALFEDEDRSRIGMVYSEQATLDFSSDVILMPPDLAVGIDPEIPLVRTFHGALSHAASGSVTVLATIGWQQWSQFQSQNISSEQGETVRDRIWENTWHVAGGFRFRVSERWDLQTGVTYDSSPTPGLPQFRTPDMPSDRQIRLGFGATFRQGDGLSLSPSFVYADYGSAAVDDPLLEGEYSSHRVVFFALSVGWGG